MQTNACVDTGLPYIQGEYNLAMLLVNWEAAPPGNAYNLEGVNVQVASLDSSIDSKVGDLERPLLFPVRKLLESAEQLASHDLEQIGGGEAAEPVFCNKGGRQCRGYQWTDGLFVHGRLLSL